MSNVVKLKIEPEFRKLVPEPSEAQYLIIKHSIEKDGFNPELGTIKALKDGTIVDGFTRHKIMSELDREITEKMVTIIKPKEGEIEKYIFKANIARRQLSPVQKLSWIDKYMPETLKKIEEEASAEKGKKTSKTLTGKKKPTKQTKGAKKKPRPKGAKAPKVRKAKADVAGVPETQVMYHDWLKKYRPDLLEREEMMGKYGDLGKAYKEGHVAWAWLDKNEPKALKAVKERSIELQDTYMRYFVQKNDPELFKEILTDGSNLQEIFDKVFAASTKKEPEKKAGPKEILVTEIRKKYQDILIEKYGEFAPDKIETRMVNYLDALIIKFNKKGE